jgi:hypothetical protein
MSTVSKRAKSAEKALREIKAEAEREFKDHGINGQAVFYFNAACRGLYKGGNG